MDSSRLMIALIYVLSSMACSSKSQSAVDAQPSTDATSRDARPSTDATSHDTQTEPDGSACRELPQQAEMDIVYATLGGVDPSLLSYDVYLPARNSCSPVPVIFYVHGGGWQDGDKRAGALRLASYFGMHGYALVSTNYRLSPEDLTALDPDRIRYPIHEQDAAAALAHVISRAGEFGVDTSRVVLFGFSAGAGIVSLLGTDESFVGAHGLDLSAISGVMALDTEAFDIPSRIGADADEDPLYENAFGSDSEVWREASALYHVEAGKHIPPFLLAERGSLSRRAILDSFREALEAIEVNVEVIDASAYTHTGLFMAIGTDDDNTFAPTMLAFANAAIE